MDARLRAAARSRRRPRLDRTAAAAGLESRRRRHPGVLLPRSRRSLSRDSELSRQARAIRSGMPAAGRRTGRELPRPRSHRDRRRRHGRRRWPSIATRSGLRVAGAGENYGVEQEHLNDVFGVRLRITTLRAATRDGRRAARISRASRWASVAAGPEGQRRRALADHDARRRPRCSIACCCRRACSGSCRQTSPRSTPRRMRRVRSASRAVSSSAIRTATPYAWSHRRARPRCPASRRAASRVTRRAPPAIQRRDRTSGAMGAPLDIHNSNLGLHRFGGSDDSFSASRVLHDVPGRGQHGRPRPPARSRRA